MSDSTWILTVVITVASAVGIYAARSVAKAGKVVDESSAALIALAALNAQYVALAPALPPIQLNFVENVSSKAKFDRFQLEGLLMRELERYEHQVESEIKSRERAVTNYTNYDREYRQIEQTLLGRSSSAAVNPDRFLRIEKKRFTKGQLPRPERLANVIVGVAYQSPQGRNSYSRTAVLSFGELVSSLALMRHQRQHANTVTARRRAERAKMTTAMRIDVLRRDQHTCRFCGAKAPTVELEVDHIVPVSRGGKTVMSNLQTLCSDCNRGKSNRFSG